ncbi:MAG: restriction endonuclease subunit S, partial [Elusimicrobiota bacterium]|nr:restriction endonuclease subunit S [Elusimicrobiota bacterium]
MKKIYKQTDITDISIFPEHWDEKKLGELFSILKGGGLSKSKIKLSGKNKCLLYGELFTTYGDIIDDIVSSTNVNEGVLSKSGDILLPGSTTTTGVDLAKASTILLDDVLLGGDIIILRNKGFDLNSEFVVYFLNTIKKFEIAEKTKGITIYHLHGKDLEDITINLPPIAEQKRIAKALSDIDRFIFVLDKKIEKEKLIKQGLMQELLTGRKRLVDFDGQDKTRQDKTRQDKTRQDKTRQDKTRQDKTRQDKTR